MRNEDDCSGLVLGLFIASIFCLCPFSISGKADYASFVRHAYVADAAKAKGIVKCTVEEIDAWKKEYDEKNKGVQP